MPHSPPGSSQTPKGKGMGRGAQGCPWAILGNVPKGSKRDCQLRSLGMAASGHGLRKEELKKREVFPPLNSQPNAKGSLDTQH